jgi:hypothetical protein
MEYPMSRPNRSPNFWIGNLLLGLALFMLLFMRSLSETLGAWATALWMAVAGTGFYYVTKDKD